MAKYRSSQLAKKKRKEFWTKTGLIFVSVFLFFICISEISNLNFFSIKQISVSGNEFISEQDVGKTISEKLNENIFWLFFPKRNAFLYPHDELTRILLEKYPRIKEVNIDLKGFSLLKVSILERQPTALWCRKFEFEDFVDEKERNQKKCYLVDRTGLIFAENTIFDKTDNLIIYYIEIGSENPVNIRLFNKDKFEKMSALVDFMKGLRLEPYSVTGAKNNSFNIYFNDGSRIIFELDQNIKSVVDNFRSLLNMEDFNIEDVSYIDLRFGNKVFYK